MFLLGMLLQAIFSTTFTMATLKSCNEISCVRVQIIVYMRETPHVLQQLRVGERESIMKTESM